MCIVRHYYSSLVFIFAFISCVADPSSREASATYRGEIITNGKDLVVQTQSGKVAGYKEEGVYIFKGIPYAEADRFMPPREPEPWEGVRSSRAYGPTSPQGFRSGWLSDTQAFAFDWDDGYPGEDCLRINIWTPKTGNDKKRPVMVWLHGGGYAAGSGQEHPAYEGSNMARRGDVVVVSLNHRLNVLGFLDLSAFGDKYAQSGNVGLLDLVAALEWVKENIEQFGGDPNNVTLFGQSGGGGKVTTLMATPAAEGLFHKAIVQSGSLLRTMESKYSRRIGAATIEELGLKASQIEELQHIPYEQLLAAGNRAITKVKEESLKEGFNIFLFNWSPTVDGNILPSQPFEGKAPEISKNVPMMIGSTLHEFMMSGWRPELKTLSRNEAKKELEKTYGKQTDRFLEAFARAYPDHTTADLFDVDFRFRPDAVRQAKMKHEQQGAPVYMYLFTWESPVLDYALRASHCMEIPFVFDNIYRSRSMTGGGKEAYVLAERMSTAWINFARAGNPNTELLPEWPAFDPVDGATMIFDNRCEIWNNHDQAVLQLIDTIPYRGL
ncbi:carboxylesterase/lipase family protein [Proteiniphilum sp. UBA5384]|uniref:carboxylesterase/lipase family protein n=1 Tax=Proteiniphilum sp. UBA5384 TaxID=1947279 RepID=UPI0039C97FDE